MTQPVHNKDYVMIQILLLVNESGLFHIQGYDSDSRNNSKYRDRSVYAQNVNLSQTAHIVTG